MVLLVVMQVLVVGVTYWGVDEVMVLCGACDGSRGGNVGSGDGGGCSSKEDGDGEQKIKTELEKMREEKDEKWKEEKASKQELRK